MKEIKITLTEEQIESIQKQLEPTSEEKMVYSILKDKNFDINETIKYFKEKKEEYESIKSQLPDIDSNELLVDYIIKTIERKLKINSPTNHEPIPFILTDNQKEIVKGIVYNNNNIVKQSKQTGVTTIVCAVIAVMVSVGKWNNILLHNNKLESSKRNLQTIKNFLEQLVFCADKTFTNTQTKYKIEKTLLNKKRTVSINCFSDVEPICSSSFDFLFGDNIDFVVKNKSFPLYSKNALYSFNYNKIMSHWTNDF